MTQTKSEEIPEKLKGFDHFVGCMEEIILQGTDKYHGAKKDKYETIDIIPMVLGEEGYVHFVLGDLLKRVVRFNNQRRERDIFKMAVWLYLLWKRQSGLLEKK